MKKYIVECEYEELDRVFKVLMPFIQQIIAMEAKEGLVVLEFSAMDNFEDECRIRVKVLEELGLVEAMPAV